MTLFSGTRLGAYEIVAPIGAGALGEVSRELFYIGDEQARMMRVQYSAEGDRFVPSKAEPWSDTAFSGAPPLSTWGPAFDIHPDGKRFVVAPPLAAAGDSGLDQLVFVLNFASELRALTAAAR